MLIVHQSSFYLHIAIGSCALLLFWVPVFTKKGNLDHKRFGRYFCWAMYTVAISGFIMASLDLLMPLTTHAPGATLSDERAQSFAAEVRSLAMFLLSLSILVLSSTRQGWLSIIHKDDRAPLRTQIHNVLLLGLVAVGVTLGVYGLNSGSILFIIFGVLQIASGASSLRYNYKEELGPKEWWIEHLRGLIGSGIGAYTAFFVFGGRRIFEALFQDAAADVSILLWVAPGVVGSIFIAYLSRHYRNKFGANWAVKRAQTRAELF
jgi:hypothetical protein